MGVCTITYDASGGSDANSGSSTTVVSGTNGDIATTTLTLNETKDFSAANDDNTDMLYFAGNAGDRHLFRISSFNPSAGACTSITLGIAATATRTGSNWSVGGKRQTLDADTTNPDLEDGIDGWVFELEAGTYPIGQTNNLPLVGGTTNGPLELVAASGATPTISWTGDFSAITIPGTLHFRCVGITFSNTTSTWAGTRAFNQGSTSGGIHVQGCSISCRGECIYINGAAYWTVIGCDLESTASAGIRGTNRVHLRAIANVVHDCGTIGISMDAAASYGTYVAIGNVVYGCTSHGIQVDVGYSQHSSTVANNVCHDNGGDGIYLAGTPTGYNRSAIYNNLLTDNAGYGIDADASDASLVWWNDYNAFRGNTSGEVNTSYVTKGSSSVTLTADPYTDETSDDYTLNATAGGGAACKDAGLGYSG